MTAVNSSVGVYLKMKTNANPTVQSASPAPRTTDCTRFQKLVFQGNVSKGSSDYGGGDGDHGGGDGDHSGANQLQQSKGKKGKRNMHSSKKETLSVLWLR